MIYNYIDTNVVTLEAARFMPKLLPETLKLFADKLAELVVTYRLKPVTLIPLKLKG